MLSIKPLKSAQSAYDYYLKAFNYYNNDATAVAWYGKAKEYLSLGDNIEKDLMLKLLEGKIPDGTKLQNNRGEHRPGFDMTFSAPKSVSVLVGLGAASDLEQMHDKAVKYALSQVEEKFAEIRFVKNGEINFEKTGNLLFATFRQPSSRANDPDLHTHCVTINLTFKNGKAKSLATDAKRINGVVEQVQNNAHFIGLLYRHNLANQLKDAGYSLRLTGDGLFEIEGVPQSLLRHFSRRREDIENYMHANGLTGAKSASDATLLTRNKKEEFDINVLKKDWQTRTDLHDFDAKEFVNSRNKITKYSKIKIKIKELLFPSNQELTKNNIAKNCVKFAIETLSQRTSVFTDRELLAESMKHSFTFDESISQDIIQKAINDEKDAQNLYESIADNQTYLTTPWLMTLETESLARIKYNKESVTPIALKSEVLKFQKEIAISSKFKHTASQKEAMTAILTTKDRYLAIQGYAGTAKTTMLKDAKFLIEEKGFNLRGITIASSASHELQSKANIKTDVFPVVYQELKNAARNSKSKTIYIVDEASMLSSPQGHELIKLIEYTNSRLILIGDKSQLSSVNNGRIFGLTQDYGIQSVLMNDIVRQKNASMRQAVVHATHGEVQKAIENLTHVEELESYQDRIKFIANTWLAKNNAERNQTLVFAPTNKNREDITNIIRQGLKEQGSLVGKTIAQTTLKAKPLESIQQRFISYYQPGDVIRLNKDFRPNRLKQGKYYTIDNIGKKHQKSNILPLRDELGNKYILPLKSLPQYKTTTAQFERIIELYQENIQEFQVGDKVLFTRNSKIDNIRNGQTSIIADISDKTITFTLEDKTNLVLDKNNTALKHLDYGYVLTNYKAQGKDANFAIGLMDSHQKFSANLRNFYVQISRAINSMTLVTDNKEYLIDAISRNKDDKKAVLDKFTSSHLRIHSDRFKSKIPINAVIDKKLEFEKSSQSLDFNYIKFKQSQLHTKELEK